MSVVPLVYNQISNVTVGMSMGPTGQTMLDQAMAPATFMMSQQTSQCCRFGPCQPNIHWLVSGYQEVDTRDFIMPAPLMTIREDAPYVGRCLSCWYPGFRPTRWTVYAGAVPGDYEGPINLPVLMIHEKETTCPISGRCLIPDDSGRCHEVIIPCCCFLPKLKTYDPNYILLGSSEYLCCQNDAPLCCCPSFGINDASGQRMYHLKPQTCCGCCCIPNWTAYDMSGQNTTARIYDMWRGLKGACCTNKKLHALVFPPVATTAVKAAFMGAALLIDMTLEENRNS